MNQNSFESIILDRNRIHVDSFDESCTMNLINEISKINHIKNIILVSTGSLLRKFKALIETTKNCLKLNLMTFTEYYPMIDEINQIDSITLIYVPLCQSGKFYSVIRDILTSIAMSL